MNPSVPLLFYGDSPTLPTGLSKIGKDLSSLIAAHLSEFRVGFYGRGGQYDRRLPFPQYNFQPSPYSQWGELDLSIVWGNFAGAEQGIIFTIWDPSRLTWFGDPQFDPSSMLADPALDRLSIFLNSDRFARWGYFPIDALGGGADGTLTAQLTQTIAGYDRVLAYTEFGARVIQRSLKALGLGERQVDWIPHGYDPAIFHPAKDGEEVRRAKEGLGFSPSDTIIGCVMSNQYRKDWGTWAATCHRLSEMLRNDIPNLKFWAHVDSLDMHWDLRVLIEDFQLWDVVRLTTDTVPDDVMAERYRACAATFLPSLGEGFGYPIVESMACGVPCVHVEYGGGNGFSFLNASPAAFRRDTRWNVLRPVLSHEEFAVLLARVLHFGLGWKDMQAECVRQVEHLQWKKLWAGAWRPWLLEGIGAASPEKIAPKIMEVGMVIGSAEGSVEE